MIGSPRWSAFVNVEDPSDVIWFDASARRGRVDLPADRPSESALTLSLDGRNGRTVVEVVPVSITNKYARFWVRRLEGPWPTPDALVGCLVDGFAHFGATVDVRPDDVALVEVAID